jgi:hypothetical protein
MLLDSETIFSPIQIAITLTLGRHGTEAIKYKNKKKVFNL